MALSLRLSTQQQAAKQVVVVDRQRAHLNSTSIPDLPEAVHLAFEGFRVRKLALKLTAEGGFLLRVLSSNLVGKLEVVFRYKYPCLCGDTTSINCTIKDGTATAGVEWDVVCRLNRKTMQHTTLH